MPLTSAAAFEAWQYLGFQIRLGVRPTPRLLRRHGEVAATLVRRYGHHPWRIHSLRCRLLMDCAVDVELPLFWRRACNDAAHEVLGTLAGVPVDPGASVSLASLFARLPALAAPELWADVEDASSGPHPRR